MQTGHDPQFQLPQIELLRILAMAGIFLFHLWSEVPLSRDQGLLGEVVGNAARFGFVGVLVFNFITGFVLALPYLGSAQRPLLAFRPFFYRRMVRICPHYYLALLLWTVPWVWLNIGSSPGKLFMPVAAHLLFIHSALPSMFFSIVPAYWWLGLLFQFYVVFPLVLWLFKRLGATRAGLLVCASCWTLWLLLTALVSPRPGDASALCNYMLYYNLPFRLPEFALGMWLAAAWNPVSKNLYEKTSWVPLATPFALLVCCAWLFALFGPLLIPMKALPARHIHLVACCLVFMVAVLLSSHAIRWGQSRWVSKLAIASYSVYLLHQPLLSYMHTLLRGVLQPLWEFVLLLFGVGVLAVSSAFIFDRFVIWLRVCVRSMQKVKPAATE